MAWNGDTAMVHYAPVLAPDFAFVTSASGSLSDRTMQHCIQVLWKEFFSGATPTVSAEGQHEHPENKGKTSTC